MKNLRNFLICVYYNKATFLGYILAPAFPVGIILNNHYDSLIGNMLGIIGMVGFLSLIFTVFGFETYQTFRRTLYVLKNYDRDNNDRICNTYHEYCDKRGVQAALAVYKKYYKNKKPSTS